MPGVGSEEERSGSSSGGKGEVPRGESETGGGG